MIWPDAIQSKLPIMSMENEERVQLETLREDIQTPAFLDAKELDAINLWMNNAQTRSSTHYDPHHNLLCVVSGCKQGQNRVLRKSSAGAAKLERHAIEQLDNGQADGIHHSFDKDCGSKDSKGNKLKEKLMLHELEPLMLKALKNLVLWATIVLLTIMVDSTSTNSSADNEKHEHADFVKMTLFCLEDDPVAYILWSLHPLSLQNVFLAVAHNFPRMLEALILHLLSPVGAEVLT